MSELMDIITDCENRLGCYIPSRQAPWKARAMLHRRMTLVMERGGWNEKDLRLAFAYVQTHHRVIESPMELFVYIAQAKDLEVDAVVPDHIGMQISQAIAVEYERDGQDSDYWIDRFARSVGPFRADVLTEWEESRRRQML